MIVTEKKTREEIIQSLKPYQRIFLVGCGECATTVQTGGDKELTEIKQFLEEQGKVVVGTCIPKAPCIASQIKTEFAKNMKAVRESEAVLVLACGLGVQSVKDNDRAGLAVVPALNSICGAVMDAHGDFIEKCSACGDCILGVTAGICPVTLCPKGLLNGPCGGMDKGKCETDKEKDCVWVLIYKELAKRGKQADMAVMQGAKDYKKALKPHRIAGAK